MPGEFFSRMANPDVNSWPAFSATIAPILSASGLMSLVRSVWLVLNEDSRRSAWIGVVSPMIGDTFRRQATFSSTAGCRQSLMPQMRSSA